MEEKGKYGFTLIELLVVIAIITDINNPASSSLAQSEVWVMTDDMQSTNPATMNHVPGGGNVLYMDGHVEFIKYPGETPVSVAFATLNAYAQS